MGKKRAWGAIAIRASQPHAGQSDCRVGRDGVIKTYGGGGDGDGGDDVSGVEKDVGDDVLGKDEEEDEEDDEEEEEEEEAVVSHDASEIIEGLIRNGFGRREKTRWRFGVVPDMIHGTDELSRPGSREWLSRCGDQGGELGCW
jgi:hypothetical protein